MRKKQNCAYCYKDIVDKKYRKRKFCDTQCQQDYTISIFAHVWLTGQVNTKSEKVVKHALIHLYGAKCFRCGWAERNLKTGRIPVELEHKDGNYENNHPDNVELLCPNCHSLTPTFRALNKGNGREFRRKIWKRIQTPTRLKAGIA
jgi:hypothetical protein